MILEEAKKLLRKWASENKLVRKVYVYGSQVKGDFKASSDLDVAIEIDPEEGDTNAFTTFICEKNKCIQELKSLLKYKVDLKWYNKNNQSSITKAAVETSGILVYTRGIQTKNKTAQDEGKLREG